MNLFLIWDIKYHSFMYHIEQLRSKEIADLQSIAQDLGIKGIKSLGRDELIYRILDIFMTIVNFFTAA